MKDPKKNFKADKNSHLKLLDSENADTLYKEPIGRRSWSKKSFNENFIFFLDSATSSEKTVKLFCWALGLMLASFAIWGAFQLPKLNTNYSVEQFFPDNHPLVAEGKKIRQTFYLEDRANYLVVLELPKSQEATWLHPESLETLHKISDHFMSHPDIIGVTSLNKIQGVFESAESITIGSIFENLPSDKWKSYVQNQSIIQSQIISEDLKSTLILLEPQMFSPDKLHSLSLDIEQSIHKIAPGLTVQVGGIPAISGQFSHRLMDELKLYLVLTLLIFSIVFSVLIKGYGALVLTLMNLILVNLVILGGVAFFGVPFSALLTSLPVIVSIVVSSLLIHSLHRWAEKIQEVTQSTGQNFSELNGSQKFLTSLSVIKELALANALGSITTAIGFVVLIGSIVPLIRQYALTVFLAVVATWLLTQVYLVCVMHLTYPRLRGWTQKKSLWTLTVLKWAKPAFAIILCLAISLVVAGQNISFSARLFDDLPETDPTRVITENIDKNFGGVLAYDLVIDAEKDAEFRTLDNMNAVRTLTQKIRTLPEVGSAISYVDLLGERLPKSSESLAETMFLFSMSGSNPMSKYILDSGSKIRLSVRFHDVAGDQIQSARSKILAMAETSFPQFKSSESGLALRTHVINDEVSKALVFGFYESLVAITLLILLIFRSLRWALVACIPNLIPPATLIGIMAIAQTPIKPGVALIFSIALGLAFNNTVYLLTRLKKMKSEKKLTHLPLRQAFLQEGNPCLFETLVMFFGFMIFLTSDFEVNKTFGVYMLLSIFAGFIGDLVFLPSVLKLFPSLLLGKTKLASTQSQSDSNTDDPTPEKSVGSVAAGLALLMAVGLSGFNAEAKVSPEASAILKKVRANVESKDDQANIKMVIIEPNGEKKERVLNLSTLNDGKFYALVRIQSPADVKGTSLLAEISGDEETHWLYVPSTKKVRRVVGANKQNSGVLGSELTVEDINSTAIKGADIKIKSKNKKHIVLEVTPKKGTSIYSKVLTAVSAKAFVPLKTNYYKGERLAKTVEFSGYKKVSGKLWRAQTIHVKNLENKRGTDLYLSDLKANSGLDRDEFSVSALKLD